MWSGSGPVSFGELFSQVGSVASSFLFLDGCGRAPRHAVTVPNTMLTVMSHIDIDRRSFSSALAKNSAQTG
jgi:hypothetical protein